jgi:hypothetical protein
VGYPRSRGVTMSLFKRAIRKITTNFDKLKFIRNNCIEVSKFDYLKEIFNWSLESVLLDEEVYKYKNIEDVNNRKKNDALILGGACRNLVPKTVLEIGTSYGVSTTLIAKNCPVTTKIYTVNLPAQTKQKNIGLNITNNLTVEEIGSYYRQFKFENIEQIYVNTAEWDPNLPVIDVAFIDGCHDSSFVYNDTLIALKHCRKGSVILWHDFNPYLANVFPWIKEVCSGIDKLYKHKALRGKILHLKDSFMGLYVVD